MKYMAVYTTNLNFNEIMRILTLDTRMDKRLLNPNNVNYLVMPTQQELQTFIDANPGQPRTIRRVVIDLDDDNNITIAWLSTQINNTTYIISLPQMQGGVLTYDDQVQQIVDKIPGFVLRFRPDNHHLGEMIHECVRMLANRLELIEKKYIV